MAKPNYAFEKRQRELAKKHKKEEKAARRAQHKTGDGTPEGEAAAPDDAGEPGAAGTPGGTGTPPSPAANA